MSASHSHVNYGSSRLCAFEGHSSIMSAQFCLTTPPPRPFPRSCFYRAHPSDSLPGSSIPAGLGTDSAAWHAQASSTLFQLPFELLVMVVENIGLTDLGQFALTGKACAQLARWSQFGTTYTTRVGDASVLRRLYDESLLQQQARAVLQTGRLPHGLQLGAFPLGPCIRRLVMRTNASSLHFSGPESQRDREATDVYSRHLCTLAFIIKHALPNLRAIRFEDGVPLPRGMWEVVARSSVKELDLFNCFVGAPVEPPLPSELDHWPLTKLFIGETGTGVMLFSTRHAPMLRTVEDEDALFERLLKLCAQSVKSLKLLCCSKSLFHLHYPFEMRGMGPLVFSRLKELHLDLFCRNVNLYRILLRPSECLEALCLAVSCIIPALDTLWPDQLLSYPKLKHISALLSDGPGTWGLSKEHEFPISCPVQVILPILRQNTHLTSLTLELDSRSRKLLCWTVLPLLSAQFRNLTSFSLTLTYHDMNTDTTLLPLLSTMTTLQQLRLRSYDHSRQRSLWGVNHMLLRQHLAGLVYLRCLALGGDAYGRHSTSQQAFYFGNHCLEAEGAASYDDSQDDTPLPWSWFHGARLARFDINSNPPHLHRLQSSQLDGPIAGGQRSETHTPSCNENLSQWRAEHAECMLRHARNYFTQWSQMEWVYFGRVLIARPPQPDSPRPRYIGPREVITQAAVDAFVDWKFGWAAFVPRDLEEWAGVGVDYEGLMLKGDRDR